MVVASPGGRGSGPLADLSPTEINRGDRRAEQLLPSALSSDRVRLLSNPLGIQTVLLVLTEVLRGPQGSTEVHCGPQGSNEVLKGPTRFTEVPRTLFFLLVSCRSSCCSLAAENQEKIQSGSPFCQHRVPG